MSLRLRIALVLLMGAILPALLLGAWALKSTRAASRASEASSIGAIRREALARNLSALEEAASVDAGTINAAQNLSYTAARYLGRTGFLAGSSYSYPPSTTVGWHFSASHTMTYYIPKGILISPTGRLEIARYGDVADLLESQPTASTPFRLTVVSQTGLAWSYPGTTGSVMTIGDARLTRDYYEAALPLEDPSNQPVWTGVHPSPFTGALVATLLTPIHANGTFYGVVAVDVPVSALLAPAPTARNTSNVVVGAAPWRIFASSGATTPITDTALASGTALLPVRQALAADQPGSAIVTLGAHTYLLAYTPIGTSDLGVISTLPQADVNADTAAIASAISRAAFSNTRTYAMVLIALTLLLIGLGFALSAGPVRRLRSFADRAIAFGEDMSIRLDEKRHDELSVLARGFNQMAATVQRLTGNLEDEVRQRTDLLTRQARALAAVNGLGRELSALRSREEIVSRTLTTLGEIGYREPRFGSIGGAQRTAARVTGFGERQSLSVAGPDELGVLPAIAAELGAALENWRLFTLEAQRQEEIRTQAVLEERSRLSREMHDTLAQSFLGIILHLRNLDPGPDQAARKAHQTALDLATRGLEEARRSVLNLRPDILEARRLDEVLRDEAERWSDIWGVHVELRLAAVEIQPDRAFALMRILQEALENVRKHAGADHVTVTLGEATDAVYLTIEDNGQGLPPEAEVGGHGLDFMTERAQGLGGQLTVRNSGGVHIEVTVPKREEIA